MQLKPIFLALLLANPITLTFAQRVAHPEPVKPQETAAENTGQKAPQPDKQYRINITGMDPQLTLALLQSQLGEQAQIELEGKTIVFNGNPEVSAAVRTAIDRLVEGQIPPAEWMPAPKSALQMSLDGTPETLLGLVEQYSKHSGVPIFISDIARNFLATNTPGLIGVESIEPALASKFLQRVLSQSNAGLSVSVVEGQKTIQVLCPSQGDSMNSAAQSLLLTQATLPAFRGEDAIQVSIMLELPNTDVRSLSNTARSRIRNPLLQSILPMGSSNVMMIEGPGSWVYKTAQAFLLADEIQKHRVLLQHPQTHVFRIQYAVASDLVEVLAATVGRSGLNSAQLAEPQNSRTPLTLINADPRLNSIIVSCSPEKMLVIKQLVAALDVEAPAATKKK